MVHVVTSARTAVREALILAMPAIAWSRKRVRSDTSQLPIGMVYTPRVLTERFDAAQVAREVEVSIWIKREGGDTLEDEMDEESAVLEVAVLAALEEMSHDYDLVETQVDIDAGAKAPVGVLQMQFRVVLVTDIGVPTV